MFLLAMPESGRGRGRLDAARMTTLEFDSQCELQSAGRQRRSGLSEEGRLHVADVGGVVGAIRDVEGIDGHRYDWGTVGLFPLQRNIAAPTQIDFSVAGGLQSVSRYPCGARVEHAGVERVESRRLGIRHAGVELGRNA